MEINVVWYENLNMKQAFNHPWYRPFNIGNSVARRVRSTFSSVRPVCRLHFCHLCEVLWSLQRLGFGLLTISPVSDGIYAWQIKARHSHIILTTKIWCLVVYVLVCVRPYSYMPIRTHFLLVWVGLPDDKACTGTTVCANVCLWQRTSIIISNQWVHKGSQYNG